MIIEIGEYYYNTESGEYVTPTPMYKDMYDLHVDYYNEDNEI
jgi:hypothetical protein